jgi:hypothetical protein
LGWGNVGVVDPHVVAVTFTSNNAILRGLNPNNDTFSSDGDFDLSPPGWQKGNPTDTNNPVSQTKNTRTVVSVGITGIPSGINFVLTGTGDYGPLSYPATGIQSTGDPMVVNGLTSIQALPNRVDIVKGSIDWSVNAPLGDASSAISADRSRENKIYVTWATPGGSGITKKRVEFACFAARGAGPATPPNVTENVANRVQARLAGMAPDAWGTPCVDGWLLLDSGNRGKCDNWAVLMGCCLDILGAGSSSLALVRASSDGGPGKCLDVESKFTIHGTVYLLFDFAGGSPHNFNGWEGCCVTAGHYYAIRPRLKARDDYDMLRRLGRIGITQYWVELQPDSSLERNGAYGIKNVYEQQPIP